ncbi:hypothetical protein AAEP93_000335 [Penicillium crustosum]
MNTNQVTDDVIREEVIRLGEDNRELRRERDRMTVQRDLAEKRVEELTLKLDGACRERDQSILTVMNTARQSMPVPGRNNNSRVPRRESSHLPYNSPERFNNPKFPDAPVFSGDRGAFDSWRDKVQDKLMNSAAQYPNEEQRIAYIRSRTDGIAARKQKKGSFLAFRGTQMHHVGPADHFSKHPVYFMYIPDNRSWRTFSSQRPFA